LDSRNKATIHYARINDVTGEDVPWDHVVKGYKYEDDNYILMDDKDFKKADVEATQSVDIEEFVDLKSIDLIYFDKPYVLVPGKKAERGRYCPHANPGY